MIVIVDYMVGNCGSIQNMFKKNGTVAVISSKKEDIEKATKLILPGIGAFDSAMGNLKNLCLVELLNKKVMSEKVPILGICLGMQLMTQKSEEGKNRGLGWFEAETKKFDFANEQENLKVPHMGWNTVLSRRPHPLLSRLGAGCRFYFIHSYHIVCRKVEDIVAQTHYGYDFVSVMAKDNIYGVQFHPEKSHRFGLQLLKNFVEYT